LPLPKIV